MYVKLEYRFLNAQMGPSLYFIAKLLLIYYAIHGIESRRGDSR